MQTAMPPLPGLQRAVPEAIPFLPRSLYPAAGLPQAARPTTIHLSDGDSTTIPATPLIHSVDSIRFTAFGYDGSIPGPTLRARQGSTISVTFHNGLNTPNTMHWHGLRVRNAFDGTPVVTQDPVAGGKSFTYTLDLRDPGVYWYHPGVRADIHVDAGLYGALIVEPAEPETGDPGSREEILFLDDMLIDEAGPFPWGEDVPNHALMGRFGNRLLVNGRTGASIDAGVDETVRLFLINAANSRTFNLAFGDLSATLVATGSGRFKHPAPVGSVLIAPGERYVVDIRAEQPGFYPILNAIQAIDHFRGTFYPDVRQLAVVHAAAGPHDAATNVTAVSPLPPPVDLDLSEHHARPPDRRLDLTLRARGLPLPIVRMMEVDTLYVPPIEFNDAMPMMNWLSTGSQVVWVLRDPDTGRENMEIFWDFDVGDLVKVRVHNPPDTLHPMNHPLHVRGQRMLVLAVDGVMNQHPVWKDTALIPVASTVDLLVEMSNPGEWVFHCHIFEHLHSGMMLSFGVWETTD